jgi:EmrB/QacA subfamily drug resistance transporter
MTLTGLLILASGFSLIIFAGLPAVSRRIRGLEASSSDYKYWAFGFMAIGLFGIWAGQMSVVVALPTIANHFRTDLPTIQWTHIGYILTMSALLLPMGRLADQVGRKRVYIVGSLVFVLGSLLASRSTSLIILLLSRIVQGIGGAMTEGPGMAILASVFPPNERGRAIGLLMVVVGLAALVGPTVGGLLVDSFGWRYVFLFNIPLVLLGIASATAVPEEIPSRRERRDSSTPFDWLGAGLSALALIMLLVAMTNGHKSGWTSPTIMLAMLSFFAFLGSFVWWELRTSSPMLDLSFFRRKTFSFGVSAAFLGFLGHSATMVLTPFYLQGVLGFSPRTAGLVMVSSGISLMLGGLISGVLSDRYGWRLFTVGGLAVSATGLFLFSRLTDQSPLTLVIAALILTNVGNGTFYSPNTSSVLGSVETASYGIVSGLLTLVRLGGNIISLAMATAIITATMGSLGFEPSLNAVQETTGAGVGYAFTVGLRNAYLVMMVLLLAGMAMSAVSGKRITESEPASPTGD